MNKEAYKEYGISDKIIQLAEEVYDIINLIAIVAIFISSIISYTKQAIEKLRNILDGSDSNG